ncbi:ABC transporter protein YOR1 [Rhizoctonia solani AG-3 Rhs1AP]|uniref:ABC transporter protein YOR1 n=1 Tax=Rhizoctonia solani AG-3 Rhs1AP TaxID=1086054 RepID=A0A0A1UHS4_9AGAM|nr:ABC transporter protein YOR1 [Rhizoctonia solani AG-3 Rhs1AP]
MDHRLDEGINNERYRKHWYQLWLPSTRPAPPPASLADAPMTPLASASFLSILTYAWLTPLMTLGWQRTLQAPDLWRVSPEEEAGWLSQSLDEAWARRVEKAKVNPEERKRRFGLGSRDDSGPSLALALNDVLGRRFWIGGLFKVVGDVSQLMAPLLIKAIIRFAQERSRGGLDAPHIGQGVGLAIGLPLLTICASVCTHQFFWRSMTSGVAARAALIASIYSRGLRFGPGETQYDLINHVSTDISRVDYCAQWFHAIWTAPIQISICLILLCLQLGPAALAGFSLFVFLTPIQKALMSHQLRLRKKSMVHTDARASLLRELLGSMRIVKVCAYEAQFEDRLEKTRKNELQGIRSMVFIKAANQALAFAIPTLAAVLSFVTYAATNDAGLDPAIIFPSTALFQLLRQPLMLLPRALSSLVDAKNALDRLKPIFLTKTIGTQLNMDLGQEDALTVQDAEWVWYQQPKAKAGKGKGKGESLEKTLNEKQDQNKSDDQRADKTISFRITDVSLKISRGSVVGIVGQVGSGKSSLLLGLLGEMPQTRGSVSFGGKTAYCSQMAWIQNATLRDNVVFGRPWDEDRYWASIRDASLDLDLELLPDSDLTEIGEKGINLSGGQKQRVNIARALYDNSAEIFLLDDPLSAVDAHVGHALFHNAVLRNLKARGKTVLLVTHALHFLPAVDCVYTLEKVCSTKNELSEDSGKDADLSEDQITLSDQSATPRASSTPSIESGRIAERGTYEQLLRAGGAFAKLVEEFGKGDVQDNDEAIHENKEGIRDESKSILKKSRKGAGTGKLEGKLIKAEKRTTGSLEWTVYRRYVAFGLPWVTIPIVLLSILIAQGCFAVNKYWLVWWQNNSFEQSSRIYMVGYAALGLGYAVFALIMGITLGCLSYESSKHLHKQALNRVFHAPMSFFDTTPLGRILGVFGKDVDTIDNNLSDSIRMFIFTISLALTSVVMITILEYYFVAIAIFILILYQYFASFYRASSREIKRLDSNLRSLLYSHFSESLTGLATIRAYGEVEHFLKDNKYYIDLENRALFLVSANQRWLAIRLDFLGSLLVFSAGVMSVVGIHGVSPSEIGLILSTLMSLVQVMGMMTRQSAEVENYMNSVERVLQYTSSGDIPQEKPYVLIDKAPRNTWPSHGAIEFRDLVMSYRSGLPPVLRGVSLSVRGGEKIAVVGRTGAGKSSLMTALFRIVELTSGSILIDGLDISQMGLGALRSKIAIIPQEAGIFSGTIRSNMDPFSEHDDATLHDALRRSHLLGQSTSSLTLDSPITVEGANLSVGQRSLLSLARALVKQSKILVLDEATASVDLETDSRIQMTIQTEFADRTLLCIAHRLRTIINYDRVVVMDQGQIVEVGTPVELFSNQSGIFRSMCDQSGIDAQEMARSRGTP